MNYLKRDSLGIYKSFESNNNSHEKGPGPYLMGADTLIGNNVYNAQAEKLGDIKEIMLDMRTVIPEYGMLIVLSVSGLRCCFARHSIVTLRPSNSAILSLCSTVFANIQCCTGAQVCYRSGAARCAK